MSEYKIKEEEKATIIKKHMASRLPLIIIAIFAGLGISFYQMNNPKLFALIILPTIIALGISLFIGLKLGLKIFKETTVDILYKIENNVFTIIKNGKEFIIFEKNKICKIEKYKDNSITIFLTDKNKLFLNDKIENYENLIVEISNIHQIEFKEKKPNSLYIIGSLIMIAFMIVFYISQNKMLTVVSGVLLCLALFVTFIKVFFNKYTDKKIKYLILFVFIVIFQIILKLFEIKY